MGPSSLHGDLEYFVGNMQKVSIPWISVSRKLVLVTNLLCVVSLLFRTACLVAAGMDVVRADRSIKTELIYPSYQLFLARSN